MNLLALPDFSHIRLVCTHRWTTVEHIFLLPLLSAQELLAVSLLSLAKAEAALLLVDFTLLLLSDQLESRPVGSFVTVGANHRGVIVLVQRHVSFGVYN